MKFFIFLVSSLFGLSSAAPQHPEDGVYMFEGLINSTIQNILANLSEPIEAPSLDLSIPAAALNGTLKVQNLTLSGLKAMKVPALSLKPIGMQLNITVEFDSLSVKADHYDAHLVLIDLLPVYGKGPANIELGGVTITLSTQLNMTSGIQLLNFRIQIGLESAHFDIGGLYYDDGISDEVNKFLNDNLVNIVNSYPGLISSVLSPVIQDLINGLLAGDSALKEAFMQANFLPEEEIYNNY